MSTPAANDQFSVNTQAMSGAQSALNGMALDSKTIGATADESTGAAAAAHKGWDTAGALRAALTEWHEQVDQLTARLHQNSAAMQQTTLNYHTTNQSIADSLKVK
ncbi:hypothetical protein [Kitasatospora sp. A2-31]|uniref:hypothetical protein n=1 Tax=Kitasatospora sp. A2-31 TaxID=2916414 RepID=UPI001EED6A59|nr:hypothetical protein [Kitasatospora sp. A2-31]MCG6498820.1 hypothetical protein [Kitasatospora sp. A2-31]